MVNRCIVRNCNKSSDNCKVSFFRFPLNPDRCKAWAVACGCLDFFQSEGTLTLYKSYRVCSRHFEDRMFLNDLKNRLQSHAVPTLFARDRKFTNNLMEPLTRFGDEAQDLLATEIRKELDLESFRYQDYYLTKKQMAAKSSDNRFTSGFPLVSSLVRIPVSKKCSMPPFCATSMKKDVRRRTSKRDPKSQRSNSLLMNATLEDFKMLCDKFLPKVTAQFVKIQADQYLATKEM